MFLLPNNNNFVNIKLKKDIYFFLETFIKFELV